MKYEHVSVMLNETIDALLTNTSGIYVDCTLGAGGHSFNLASKLNPQALIIGIDQDADAIEAARLRLKDAACQVKICHSNFSQIDNILDENGIDKVDGILFDLGVSSYQIDTAERGFSYMHNAPLDMRMDTRNTLTAYDVINTYDEEQLYKIFHEYGEERFSKRIAQMILTNRKIKPIETTGELVAIIDKAVPSSSKKYGHPAKRVFQAVRIEVNNELGILNKAINSAVKRLKVGGHIAIITFHSLEDRIVKTTFKTLATGCICPKTFPVCVCGHKAQIKIIGKPITASDDELKSNSRAKSAKLRIAEKILNS